MMSVNAYHYYYNAPKEHDFLSSSWIDNVVNFFMNLIFTVKV